MNRNFGLLGFTLLLLLTGCARSRFAVDPQDYTNYRESDPKSILVLPPENHSPEVKAGQSLVAQITYPLAEAGYYVFPIAVVEETFRQNGLSNPADIRAASAVKMREIFGADALLDLTVKEYGTQYKLIDSETRVAAEAKLIDLKNGKILWTGKAAASSSEERSCIGGSFMGILINAAVKQIANTVMDKGHEIAGNTACRLLYTGEPNGLLYGPRSRHYRPEKP